MAKTTASRVIWFGLPLAAAGFTFLFFYFLSNKNNPASREKIESLIGAEELILDLNEPLKYFSKSVLNLQLPDKDLLKFFCDQVEVSGGIRNSGSDKAHDLNPEIFASEPRVAAKENLELWDLFLDGTSFFEYSKFYFVRGQFLDESQNNFETDVGFDGLAVTTQGAYVNLHVDLTIVWRQESDGWKVSAVHHRAMNFQESDALFFEDVLTDSGLEEKLLLRLTSSAHDQIISRLVNGGDYFLPNGVKYPFFFPDVTLEHPGVSIVDIDNDGFEDIYCAMRLDRNILLRNKGNGQFEEVAKQYGLAIEGDSTCAAFADFDNDGDQDLLLGRGRQPSKFLVNVDGKFRDMSNSLPKEALPALVSSISVFDYDGDGLLDAYFSTYSPIESGEFVSSKKPLWAEHFLSESETAHYMKKLAGQHGFLNRAGPPNVLIQNRGAGQFVIADCNEELQLWQMSFQSCWTDFDEDGDPDVYIANDYGPDHFFRNDRNEGFQDITKQVGLTKLGFGMGVSFGDYNNDGAQDVYVTNMFSKAGQRITSQFPDLDSRFVEMASGNFLYQNEDGFYKQVSGKNQDELHVSKAGWSWGGQFLDFNNDGFLDIYAASGYYTAPPDIALNMDL